MEFKGKTVLITGPAKGMGSAITLAFAREGAALALAGRDTGAIEPVAQAARATGAKALVCRTDLTRPAEVRALVDTTLAELGGRIDVLVQVAGVSGPFNKTLWEHTDEDYDEVMDVNVRGLWLAMKFVLPVMVKQRAGSVVNIGGTYGITGKDYRSIYSSSKWALRGLTKSAALEAGPHGVAVNLVCPGSVEGPRLENVMNATAQRLGRSYDEVRGIYEGNCALRRIATDEDIAQATLFMASPRARNITGQELIVDAGSVLMPYPPSVP
ncbi:MAG TPA: SDR family oxidoreductase, partial [Burkholderiales bacterium]|nr:SDR family oxidoreductase [Burkholderiales bacterium]